MSVSKEKYQENREEILSKNKAWKLANPDKVKECSRRYRERRKELSKEYRQKNRAKRAAQNKEYRLRHPETAINGSKKWREANKEKLIHYKVANEIEKGNMKKQSICERCGSTENVIAHHHDYSRPLDVVWLCRVCHRKEHESSPEAGEQPAPLPAEVEAAMDALKENAVFAHTKSAERFMAAYRVIKAALTEARQPKRVSRESDHVSPTGGKQQESEMTTGEPK